jgi:hypothetical protein
MLSQIDFGPASQASDYLNTARHGTYRVEYQAGADGDTQTTVLTRTIVVNAKPSYLLSFDPRGGSFANAAQDDPNGNGFALRELLFVATDLSAVPPVYGHIQSLNEAALSLPELAPRAGYIFVGWSLNASDDAASYATSAAAFGVVKRPTDSEGD